MNERRFIAGDWGTSHLRLFLCNAQGKPIETAQGPGAATVHSFARTFENLTASWNRPDGRLPAVLCGMAGSNLGWVHAPYLACPVAPSQVANACVALREHGVHIVPGLSCRNRIDAPDVLRGEETQVLGALQIDAGLRTGRHLLCLPGTHTKWVVLEAGSIVEFLTAPTGELHALIHEHGVLLARGAPETVVTSPPFRRGLAEWRRVPNAQLLHRLFECRSRRVVGEMNDTEAADYLSGLLIASDVSGALQVLPERGVVHVIGSAALTELYAAALNLVDRECRRIDGDEASIAGLSRIHALLSRKVSTHAT